MQTFSDLHRPGDPGFSGAGPGPSQSLVQGPRHSLHHVVMSASVMRLSDDNKHWTELCILCEPYSGFSSFLIDWKEEK